MAVEFLAARALHCFIVFGVEMRGTEALEDNSGTKVEHTRNSEKTFILFYFSNAALNKNKLLK